MGVGGGAISQGKESSGEQAAPAAGGQWYFEISAQFMKGRPRTWSKRADKYLPRG